MDLSEEQIEGIVERAAQRVRQSLPEWITEEGSRGEVASGGQPTLRDELLARDMELRERMIRVEEELKHQRELMQAGFEAVDKRFEAVDKRFEAVDTRFKDLIHYMDKRFALIQWLIAGGFVLLTTLMTVYEFVS